MDSSKMKIVYVITQRAGRATGTGSGLPSSTRRQHQRPARGRARLGRDADPDYVARDEVAGTVCAQRAATRAEATTSDGFSDLA